MIGRVLVLGDHREEAAAVLQDAGLDTDRGGPPDVVFCHGGDGTLLRAERTFPGVPKVPARVGARGRLCERHSLEAVARRLAAGRLEAETLGKLELGVGGLRRLALNDVVARNANPTIATRFVLEVRGERSHEITGDGLVVATPFGSTGYYRSMTGQRLTSGLGVAFNNCTENRAPLVLGDDEVVHVEILRGPVVLVYDNDPRPVLLRAGHAFDVGMSDQVATVWGLDALRCQTCLKSDGSAFNPH